MPSLTYNAPIPYNSPYYSYNGVAVIVGETRIVINAVIRDQSRLASVVSDQSALTGSVSDRAAIDSSITDKTTIPATISDASAILTEI